MTNSNLNPIRVHGDSSELRRVDKFLTDKTVALVLVENSVRANNLNFFIYPFDSEDEARKIFAGIKVRKGGYMKHYMPIEYFPTFVEKVEAVRKALFLEF